MRRSRSWTLATLNSTKRAFVLRLEGGGSELLRLQPGDVASIGSDSRNRVQLSHGSIAPLHAKLRCDEWGVWLAVENGAIAKVAGEIVTDERLVPLDGAMELGALRFQIASDATPVPAAPSPAVPASAATQRQRARDGASPGVARRSAIA